MALELDTRQRAMLQEMGVHVWLPESGVATLELAPAQPDRSLANPPEARVLQRSAQVKEEAAQRPGDTEQSAGAPALRAQARPQAQTANSLSASDWPALAQAVRNCQACGTCAGRTNPTLLEPMPDMAQCDWMVVGDVPDEDEDRAGAPFAGQDGVLLANMLRALGLQRANPLPSAAPGPVQPAARRAYITNVLKCRPAMGAMPQAAELAQCAAYLQREIALVQPKIILSMGRFANQSLLADTPALVAQPLGKLRGSLHSYRGIPVVVTYPPKLLMRNGADKAKAWADLCFAATAKLAP